MPLVPPALAWLAGMLLGLFWPGGRATALGWVGGAAMLTGAALALCWADRRARWAGLLLLALWLGLARSLPAVPSATPLPGSLRALNVPAGQARAASAARRVLRGHVLADPDPSHSGKNAQVRVAVEAVQDGAGWRPVHGGLLVVTDRFVPVAQGDTVECLGVVQAPPPVKGFDYARWLLWHGIESYMDRAMIRVLPMVDTAPTTLLAVWRRAAGQRTATQLPEPAAGLLRGLLLGQQKAIDPALWADFNTTQTSWLIVVSGSQITMLLLFVYWVSRRVLAPWPAVAVAGTVVVAYSLFVGLGLSVARAALMGLLYLLARGLGRPITPLNLLACTALILTAFDPLSVADAGFQLSFAAVAGILILGPPLVTRWRRIPILGEAFAISWAAQLGILPIVIAQFGAISLTGFGPGTLIGLIIGPLMILGAVYEITAWLWAPLGQVIAWVCWLPLTLIASVVQLTGRFPPLAVVLPDYGWIGIPFWYALLALGYLMGSPARRAAVRRFLRPAAGPAEPVAGRT